MTLDPQVETFLASMKLANPPGWHQLGPLAGRERMAGMLEFFGSGDPHVSSEDHYFDLDDVSQPVRVRIYKPNEATQKNLPVTVYAHGGGWIPIEWPYSAIRRGRIRHRFWPDKGGHAMVLGTIHGAGSDVWKTSHSARCRLGGGGFNKLTTDRCDYRRL